MKEKKILTKVLADNQLKVTKARLLVFELLQNKGPQSLAELIAQSRGKIDRVSVYRVIDLFEKLGIARKVTIGWKYKVELSEIFLDHHHHVSCLKCGKIVAVEEDPNLETIIHNLVSKQGFTVTAHQLELQGYCKKCQT